MSKKVSVLLICLFLVVVASGWAKAGVVKEFVHAARPHVTASRPVIITEGYRPPLAPIFYGSSLTMAGATPKFSFYCSVSTGPVYPYPSVSPPIIIGQPLIITPALSPLFYVPSPPVLGHPSLVILRDRYRDDSIDIQRIAQIENELQALRQEIKDLEEKIESLKKQTGPKVCPKCGKEVSSEWKYCPDDGTDLSIRSIQNKQEVEKLEQRKQDLEQKAKILQAELFRLASAK